MQQIRILDDHPARIPGSENMRLLLSERPDRPWMARLRERAAATDGGPALNLRVEGRTLFFRCADRADLEARRGLIGQLIDRTNAEHGSRDA
jgi:hypothetical protein